MAEMELGPGLGNPGPFCWVPLGRSWYEDLLAGADVAQQCIWEADGKDTLPECPLLGLR